MLNQWSPKLGVTTRRAPPVVKSARCARTRFRPASVLVYSLCWPPFCRGLRTLYRRARYIIHAWLAHDTRLISVSVRSVETRPRVRCAERALSALELCNASAAVRSYANHNMLSISVCACSAAGHHDRWRRCTQRSCLHRCIYSLVRGAIAVAYIPPL